MIIGAHHGRPPSRKGINPYRDRGRGRGHRRHGHDRDRDASISGAVRTTRDDAHPPTQDHIDATSPRRAKRGACRNPLRAPQEQVRKAP